MHPPPGGSKSSKESLLLPNLERDALLLRLLTFRLVILAIPPSHFHLAAELIT